jgi:hypothetical protein
MAIVINGSGTVTGLAVGGLPDGTVDAGTLATDSVTAAKIAADSVDSAELIDGAVDRSKLNTSIADSGNATAITIDSAENVGIGTNTPTGFEIRDKVIRISKQSSVTAYRIIGNDKGNDLAIQSSDTADGTAYTSRLNIMNDGRGLSQFTAKAWISFNAQGTAAIKDSHNISSLGDNGTGWFYAYIDVDLANGNACAVGSGSNSNNTYRILVDTAVQITSAVYIMCSGHSTSSSVAPFDPELVYMVCFGD